MNKLFQPFHHLRVAIALLLMAIGFSLSSAAYAVDPPSNIRIENSLLMWDNVPQSSNIYNIYFIDAPVVDYRVSPRYITTVTGENQFRPSTPGYYTVVTVAYNNRQEFSNVADGEIVYFAGAEDRPSSVSRNQFSELKTQRCDNMVAGGSCSVQCSNRTRRIPTGGACRADAGVVLHQRARQDGYECLSQQDSSFVEVDVYCLDTTNFR